MDFPVLLVQLLPFRVRMDSDMGFSPLFVQNIYGNDCTRTAVDIFNAVVDLRVCHALFLGVLIISGVDDVFHCRLNLGSILNSRLIQRNCRHCMSDIAMG